MPAPGEARQHWRYWCQARAATSIAKDRATPIEPKAVVRRLLRRFHREWQRLASSWIPSFPTLRNGADDDVILWLIRRNMHELYIIRAFDAISRESRARLVSCRGPISIFCSLWTCCSPKAA